MATAITKSQIRVLSFPLDQILCREEKRPDYNAITGPRGPPESRSGIAHPPSLFSTQRAPLSAGALLPSETKNHQRGKGLCSSLTPSATPPEFSSDTRMCNSQQGNGSSEGGPHGLLFLMRTKYKYYKMQLQRQPLQFY